MKPLLFLDCDGVLNSRDWYMRRNSIYPEPQPFFTCYELCPDACARLQALCSATGAEIVLTSTWRRHLTLPEVQELFLERGITAPVIGRTPDLRHSYSLKGEPEDRTREWHYIGRGLEVQWWLRTYLGSAKAVCEAKFCCLDDDQDFGDLLGKLVQTRNEFGLTDRELEYIYKHLGETLMNSGAAGGKGRVFFEIDALELEPWWNRQEGPFGPPTPGGSVLR